jgi:hypothetical protein
MLILAAGEGVWQSWSRSEQRMPLRPRSTSDVGRDRLERRDEGRQLRAVHTRTREESSGIAITARKESGTMSPTSSASSCQHAYACEEPRKE